MPYLNSGWRYYTCCGKVICSGCAYAPLYDNQGNEVDNEKCPFCRTPDLDTDEENITRMKKRVEANDPIAIHNVGCYYLDGMYGYPLDYVKALELWHRAGELGHPKAYNNIGNAYNQGEGVEVDERKATHYYELSAMKGDVDARHNLGLEEEEAGNWERALKHFIIAIRGGDSESLKKIKELYSYGYATKEDYTKALQSYQRVLGGD